MDNETELANTFEQAGADEKALNATLAQVNEILQKRDDFRFTEYSVLADFAFAALAKAAKCTDLAEITGAAAVLPPNMKAQLIMEIFGLDLDVSAKQEFIEIANWMGPDYLDALRKATAFMIKVESF